MREVNLKASLTYTTFHFAFSSLYFHLNHDDIDADYMV